MRLPLLRSWLYVVERERENMVDGVVEEVEEEEKRERERYIEVEVSNSSRVVKERERKAWVRLAVELYSGWNDVEAYHHRSSSLRIELRRG